MKNETGLIIAGIFLGLNGIKLIFNPSTKSIGALIALVGVLLNIIAIILIIKQNKWLDEA